MSTRDSCADCGTTVHVDDWTGCPRCHHLEAEHFEATLERATQLAGALGDEPPRPEDSLLDELHYEDARLPGRSEEQWLTHMRGRHARIVDRAEQILGPAERDTPEETLRLEDLEPGFDFPEVAVFDVSPSTCVLIYLQTRPGEMQVVLDVWSQAPGAR